MGRVEGKVAIVTGASGGIGSVIVQMFLEEGATVAGFDVTAPTLDLPDEHVDRFLGVAVDITDEDSVRRGVAACVESFGEVTVLINAAGVLGVSKPPHEVDRTDFDRTFAVNVTGTWLAVKHTVPSMLRAGRGSIVNISSVGGLLGGTPMTTYAATKGAIRSMSRSDAITYASHGIRVNSVYPGSIATPMSDLAAENSPEGPEAYRARLNAAHPLGHRGEPEDIAYAVLYLASEEAKFTTGSEMIVDGGFSAQ